MKIKTLFLLTAFFSCLATTAQKPAVQGVWNQLFAGPAHPSDHDAWITQMKNWRADERKKLDYTNAEYFRKELSWTRTNFIFVQAMAHDRYLYDPQAGKYTVDKFLKDVTSRYGGIEGILLWPTYPNIGVDNRNQYDLFADMPGGREGVRRLIADFHKRGIKVFIPIMFWDHGTRQISDPMYVALTKEIQELGADGLTGDTMHGIPVEFKKAYDSIGYPVALQPELTIYDHKMLEWNTMSWNYYWDYTRVPGVSIYKWMEPRHQVHVTNRWAIDKTDDLQYAFFNGIGYNPWENIWGIWNQVPERYAEALRRIASIYRQFPDVWSSKDWEPHIPALRTGVYASRFPGEEQVIYTLVNRDSVSSSGPQLSLPYKEGMEYFDIWNGVKLEPLRINDRVQLSFGIEARGFGAVLAARKGITPKSFKRFMAAAKKAAAKPLNNIPDTWKPLPQQIVPIENTSAIILSENASAIIPSGNTSGTAPSEKIPGDEMIRIPAVKGYRFESHGVMIEGNELPAAIGVQHPWQGHPSRDQSYNMDIPAFYIDKYPVTNEQFKAFIDATRYQPEDPHNFLKDWKNGTYPAGWGKKPVTWVSLEDARAYAKWAGKRLPHEWEWQYAAQGKDNLLYPWGNEKDSTRMPLPDTTRAMRPPTDVNAFPRGANAAGVTDLVGNVWQWTDEYRDAHTRSAILKGGSYFSAQTSFWYFPQAYELNKYAKYLLMAPSLDRAGTIGFRCVKDGTNIASAGAGY